MGHLASLPLESELSRIARAIDDTLMSILPTPQGAEMRLLEAMRYAALADSKRLRGFLAVQSGRLFGMDERAMLRVAAALECLHTYALVHDDLPAIDDEDERRGQPATHKAYDEATAILAGDALVTLSFAVLASPHTCPDPFGRCALVTRAAEAVGHAGMVGGQMIHLSYADEGIDIGTLTRLQRMKTGSLIAFACEAGPLMARASEELLHAMSGYAHDLGLAFQIRHDIRRESATREESSRASFASIMGMDRAQDQAELLARQAVRHLDLFDEKADPLRHAADFVVKPGPERGA